MYFPNKSNYSVIYRHFIRFFVQFRQVSFSIVTVKIKVSASFVCDFNADGTMDARRIFFRGGQWGGLKDGSPPSGSRGSSPVGVLGGTKPPEADQIFSKWCINTSSTEVLNNICRKKKHLTFPGESAPCPCLRAPMDRTYHHDSIFHVFVDVFIVSFIIQCIILSVKRVMAVTLWAFRSPPTTVLLAVDRLSNRQRLWQRCREL